MCEHIHRRLPAEAMQDSNAFRRERCYLERVDEALRSREASLRAIFDVYSRVNRNLADDTISNNTMSIGEWLDFCEHMGLFESSQLSLFGAKMIFKWSRIRTALDYTAKSERKLRNLAFEDFLEAFVRVACVMALPTDQEVASAGVADAGEYLIALRSSADEQELLAFVQDRKVGWQHEPKQKVWRCVGHLLTLVTRVVEQNTSRAMHGRADAAVSEAEAEAFEKMRRRGGALAQVQSAAAILDGVRAAASIVRARLLATLRHVDVFNDLADEQLERLCNAMQDSPYERGQCVVEQGDEGDACPALPCPSHPCPSLTFPRLLSPSAGTSSSRATRATPSM